MNFINKKDGINNKKLLKSHNDSLIKVARKIIIYFWLYIILWVVDDIILIRLIDLIKNTKLLMINIAIIHFI